VIELQKILIAAGLLHVNAPTGWFGSQTKAALKLWQTSQAISATGYVGPLTRAALNTLTGVSSTTTH
jgi:peptidoglycan hydrolase-like protein with peptidoglycan-binding domain